MRLPRLETPLNFYLLPALGFGPQIILRLLHQLPEAQLDHALHPGRFTPREVVAHLADWEPIMRERIRTAVARPGSVIPAYDEGQVAIDHQYSDQDPWEQARIFARERLATEALLRGLGEADWRNSVEHPERGTQSVEDLANTLLGHDLYHIEQISEHLSS